MISEETFKIIAEKLPDYEAKTMYMSGKEIKCSGLPYNKEFCPPNLHEMKDNLMYKVEYPVYEESATLNHIRRLRRRYNRNGRDGILHYLKQYMGKDQLQIIKQWLSLQ